MEPNLSLHYGANELEEVSGYTDGKIRKRLNDLRKAGRAIKQGTRISDVSGKKHVKNYSKRVDIYVDVIETLEGNDEYE